MRVVPCPRCFACGAPGDVLYERLRDNLFSAPGTWSLKKCRSESCGILWLDPMPATDDLFHAYQDYYTHGKEPARSTLFRFTKSIYRLAVDGFLLVAGVPIERKRAALMFLGDRSPGTILDIGCGQGTFLALMAKRGWTVAGVDFDIAAVTAARRLHGIDVRVGTVGTIVDSGNKFDVVTASHVIEHVPDPLEFLVQCRKLLRAGGCVVLRTPNVDSLGHRRYGRSWRGLESPRHLHLFTVAALEACGKRAGFADTLCFTSSVGAEGILLASHFLEKRGEFRPSKLSKWDALESKLLGPLFALRGKIAWLRDRNSGEEICAVMTNGKSATAE
jgi:2-polyprenyl-3-methyl-5-hydroxy-6-metoxy-1,4-benzoquinol methylase